MAVIIYKMMSDLETNLCNTNSGSFLVRKLVVLYPEYRIYVIDKLDYCGSLHNLKAVKEFPNYSFVRVNQKSWYL
jgi:dTDP-D-glucose 4,6-dehydratase